MSVNWPSIFWINKASMRQLEDIVSNYFKKDNKLHDKSFKKLSPSEIKDKYLSIKSYLGRNYKIGDRVAIYIDKDYQYIILILVCLELGLTFIPLNKKLPRQRIATIINISKPSLLINDGCEIFDCKQDLLNNLYKDNKAGNFLCSEVPKDNIAYIIFTSGSTGEPKGVMIKRESYANFVQWVDLYFSTINSNDRLLNTADFTFDLSLIDIALLLTKNINFFISNFGGNIFELMSEIENEKITTMATVPNNFQMLLAKGVYERGETDSLQHLLIGGARFSYGLYNKLKKHFQEANVYNLYGPTEATVYCSVKKIQFNETDCIKENVSAGKAIKNVDIRIVDEVGNKLGINQVGRLLVGGVQVMDRYINHNTRNTEVLIIMDNQVHYDTGDLAFVDINENLFIVGRSDDSLKVDGYRVNLSDVDSNVQKLEYVEECASVAVEDEIKENILITFIKTNQIINTEEIFSDLEKIMASYQIPKRLIFIEKFPLNSSGKICRKTLKQDYLK